MTIIVQRFLGRTAAAALAAFVLVSSPCAAPSSASLSAQLISVRTVPVASGDQFLTVPSATLGMAGTRIAIDDSLSDGWSNPGKGIFVTESAILGSPTLYTISRDGGGGRTLPLTGLLRGGDWFGGVSVALQQIDNRSGNNFWRDTNRLSESAARNLYARALAGRKLGRGGWSVGLAASTSDLNAMDGVDLLYGGADHIDQYGSQSDLRAGVFRTGARDRVGLTLVHNRVSMTHDVTYTTTVFDSVPWSEPTVETRREVNEDRTRTWGAHFEWDRKLRTPGWRIGATLTTNYKSHPKIPNYQIQNIPRDPGTTWAYEIGLGVARSRGPTTFGLDVALQPIRSHTWQEADGPVETPGGTLAAGDKTIENRFVFSNLQLRTGVSHDLGKFGFRLGIEARSYDYGLDQENHIEATTRRLDESWLEWTPALGANLLLSDVELQYGLRITLGTGHPGTDLGGDAIASPASLGSDFIAAPRGPLTLRNARVMTHQIWIRVPIR